MERNHLEVALADLRGKFELVLEGYAALHAALQEQRREAREQHELLAFLLKAVAADLDAHRADPGVHFARWKEVPGRPTGRPSRLTAHRSPR